MYNIYFSENNDGKPKFKIECFEVRNSIESCIRFIVTLWPEENPVQQIALITNAVTNTVVATVMRGPNGECMVTIPDLNNPRIHVYSVTYDTIVCPACHGKDNKYGEPCEICYGKGAKNICRVSEAQTVIHMPVQVTEEHPQYDDV